jgi:hypothetical protein
MRVFVIADAGRDGMAAMMVRAVNEDAAGAGIAHLSEGDFLRLVRCAYRPLTLPTMDFDGNRHGGNTADREHHEQALPKL